MRKKRFFNSFDQLQKNEKLTRAQVFLGVFGTLLFLALAITLPNTLFKKQNFTKSHAETAVPGQGSLICTAQAAQQLTSPWTYHALASGSQTYTVAQYQALPGYGTTLPPLPSYITSEDPNTEAAVIFAPGSTTDLPPYTFSNTPHIYFFEGGAYGVLNFQSNSGDEFIGGSTTGFPEPTFDSGGGAYGISAQNDSYGFAGGASTLAATANVGATTITTTTAIPGYIRYLTFSDGSTYSIDSNSGTSITIDSPLSTTEASGSDVWAAINQPIAEVVNAAAQGASSVTLTASSTTLVPYGEIRIGAHQYQIASTSGSLSGYTLTIGSLDTAVNAKTPVYYDNNAGGVTVEYLDIAHDQHTTTGTIYTGSGWTIMHNNIHDGYSSPGYGVAIYGGDQGTIEYNCLSKMGDYGANIFGKGNKFDYNEVYESNYEPDPGCGCSGGGKWWATLNADIVDNAFINDSPGGGQPIWLDNGNAGTLISGNYFDQSYASAIHSETGYNLNVSDNLFENDGWGNGTGGCSNNCNGVVNINHSGGWHIPNSRYDNQIIIANNQFINDWEGLSLWQSGARSCDNSGEGWPEDASYCSGGFPITQRTSSSGQYYFSHFGDTTNYGTTTIAEPAASGSTVVLTAGAMAINDQIGFANAMTTTTSDTTDVSTLTGSGTVTVGSTSGFPSSGQLRVGTSAAWSDGNGSYTGAILSYTGTTSTSFTGVTLLRGKGTLSGPVWQVQPYKVLSQTCYANDCAVTISPALTSAVSTGTTVTNAGTCQLFATSGATPTSPLAPDGNSYWEGCQWETRNVSITGNTFVFDPTTIAAGAPLTGGSTTNCTASHPNGCGVNFMAFQPAGEAPFDTYTGANAFMSNSTFTGCPSWDTGCSTNPLSNINALANPPSAPVGNGARQHNILWSDNAYSGPWEWDTYIFGSCATITDSTTGKSMPSGACSTDFSDWQSDWEQDSGSTYSATASGSLTPTPLPHTASITTSPSSQSVSVGSNFTVAVGIDGGGQTFNAAQATVSLSPNLTVTNIAAGDCNFSYTQTPTTSDPSFAGAILSGSANQCTAYTMTLHAVLAGTGTVTFSNGSVKAYADSSEIYSSATNGSYSLTTGPTATPTPTNTPTPTPTGVPTATPTPTGAPTPTPTSVPTPTPTTGARKVGDFNGDNVVDATDLSIFAVNWLRTTANLTNSYTDINGDGIVDLTDFSLFAKSYGQ